MQRFYALIFTIFLGLGACFGPPRGAPAPGFDDATAPADDATAPADDATCAPGSRAAAVCERAYYVGLHCCWDARGFSRDFDQWDPTALTPRTMCTRLLERGENPEQRCARWMALFDETSDDDGGTCPTFNSYLATSGFVLGLPACCCNAGEACVQQDAGAPLACVR